MPVPIRRIVPETFIAAFAAAAAALMATGYLLDAVGLPLHPMTLAVTTLAAGVTAFLASREPSPAPAAAVPIAACVVAAALGYMLWLASPSLLPVTDGPDVVHHLLLIRVIHRTHRLVHDPALEPYLLEMMNYTPGGHIAAAAVAHWLRVDPLRVLQPLTALFVAVKLGIVYVLTLRLLPDKPGAPVAALAAPFLLFVAAPYLLGSFFQFFFYSQVLSETFALAMVLAALGWMRTAGRRYLWLAAACGVGVFLSWPVWIAPAGAAVLAAIATAAVPIRRRLAGAAVVVVPVGLIAMLHTATHAAGASIVGSSGVVTRPSIETLGISLIVPGVAGTVLALRSARARPVVVLLAATILQGLALAIFDARAGARSFYLPYKMAYLAVLPFGVLGAYAVVRLSDTIVSRLPLMPPKAAARLSVVPLVIAAFLAGARIPIQRQRSPISEPALAAGLWARDALPPGCIDYFSRHWLTGYWLHLDVLGNPRLSDRMRAETFDFPDVVGKWILRNGLPYGIVEDVAAIPREARADMTVLREFGRAAVVKNNRPAAAPGSDREAIPCRESR